MRSLVLRCQSKNKEDIAAERNNKFTHTLDSCYEMQRYKII